MHPSTILRRTHKGATLLSLDGGGVKGISSLLILQKIMVKVKDIENNELKAKGIPEIPDERKPKDYFDLTGGTSTGGLIALMLCRLNMNTTQVIEKYDELAEKVFSPTIGGWEMHKAGIIGYWAGNGYLWAKRVVRGAGFSASRLEEAIDKVTTGLLEAKGETKLLDESGGSSKMLMCATIADKAETMLFRSYRQPPDSKSQSSTAISIDEWREEITIKEACRGTSAAPTYLPEMKIRGITFWDGGLLNNNPVDQVWDARYDLPGACKIIKGQANKYVEPDVLCVVSLGTSYAAPTERSWYNPAKYIEFIKIASRVMSYTTNTEAKHWDFQVNNIRRNKRLAADKKQETHYFRFNAKVSKDINLDDYQQMPLLKTDTERYLENLEDDRDAEGVKMVDEQERYLDRCAELLARTVPEQRENAAAGGSQSLKN